MRPHAFHLSRSLKKALRKQRWRWRINYDFDRVIDTCRSLRAEAEGTWISHEVMTAYQQLHQSRYAFSMEVFCNDQLAGGFYGVAMGRVFFGESMFSLVENGSKVALWQFCQLCPDLGIDLIDCQVHSDHLISLGAEMQSKRAFVDNLNQLIPTPSQNQRLIELAGCNTFQAVHIA